MRRYGFLIIFLFVLINNAFADIQGNINNGLNWLLTNQNSDGSYGNQSDLLFRDTTEVLNTLNILNQKGSQYQSGIQWSANTTVNSIDFIERKILLLSTESIDTTTGVNILLSNQNTDGGWGIASGFESDPLDTALALQALKAVNYSDQAVIASVIGYLLSTQNSDGGWGIYPSLCSECEGDESNVYMTALVSSTLQQFSRTTSIATAINKATSYLIAHQNQDGGFGSGGVNPAPTSTVFETAYAYLALVSVTTDATVLGNAINYITNAQLPNGSWEDDPYSTALALRALANVKPNLSVLSNDITFSNSSPTVGEIVTITAVISNTGPGVAENITVQFFDGDPNVGGVLIGGTTISSIPAYSSSSATISWTIPEASTKVIFVKIDPSNTIDELKENFLDKKIRRYV